MVAILAAHTLHQIVELQITVNLHEIDRMVIGRALAIGAAHANDGPIPLRHRQRVSVFVLDPVWLRHENELGTNACCRQGWRLAGSITCAISTISRRPARRSSP